MRLGVQVVCVLFLVIAANVVGFQYFVRWDFSRSQKFTLAEQTKQVLRQLQKPVEIVVYFGTGGMSLESALYGDVRNLLREFEFSGRDRVEVEFVDPARDLSRAQELQTKYAFAGDQNVLILDYDGRTAFLPVVEMGQFDLSGVAMGEPARLLAFAGEQALTGALLGLLNPERKKVYLLEGHGEVAGGELSYLADGLKRQNADLVPLNLAGGKRVPEDASVVLVGGATYDLAGPELAALRNYWEADGRLIVALDPEADTPELAKWVGELGIMAEANRVLQVVPAPLKPGTFYVIKDVPGVFIDGSPVTKRLGGVNGLFPVATQSLSVDSAKVAKAAVQVRPLVGVPEQFWGEADFAKILEGVKYDDGVDAGQPLAIAISAERGGTRDDRVEVATAKMVVVGNRDFLRDATIQQAGANLDFLLSAVNWMVDRATLTGITPKVVKQYTLSLTPAQIDRLGFYVMVGIPGVVALFGLIVAWRRRA
jgi:hypothetical protein